LPDPPPRAGEGIPWCGLPCPKLSWSPPGPKLLPSRPLAAAPPPLRGGGGSDCDGAGSRLSPGSDCDVAESHLSPAGRGRRAEGAPGEGDRPSPACFPSPDLPP